MENKKKPSTVTLSHHADFQFTPGNGSLLRLEMLDWPIFERNGYTRLDEIRTKTHRTALAGLLKIELFDSVVSIKVDEEKKCLIRAYRTQGELFLNREVVLSLRYHSIQKNKPYVSLEEWPELESTEVYKTLSEWTENQWIDFFLKRVRDKAEALNKKAQAKRSDAQILEDRAEKILKVFS